MKKAVILHGTMGSPEGNWFQWLKNELQGKGLEVWLPALPNAKQPSLSEWSKFITSNCPFSLDEDTIIIGHSSGAILALIIAQQSTKSVGAIVAVSVFHDNSLKWEANDKLFDVDFDFPAIKQHTKKLIFIHSDNDPYVPLSKAQYVADNCGSKLIVISGQGHFNLENSPSYSQFPKLLEILETQKLL